MKIVLTLSHGQASVEHGFNHNNTVVQTNMNAESNMSDKRSYALSQIIAIYYQDNWSNDKRF